MNAAGIDVSKEKSMVSVIDDWIDYYNNDRYQWQLAKLPPNEFYRYLVSGVYPLLGKPSFDANPDSI